MAKEQKAADDMATALDWLRDGVVDAPDDNVGTKSLEIDSFRPFGAGEDSKEVGNALNWLTKKNPDDLTNIDSSDFSTLGRFYSIPKSKEQERAQQMNKALDWLRSNGANFDGGDIAEFSNYTNDFVTNSEKTEKALDWPRGKDPGSLDELGIFGLVDISPKTKEQEKWDNIL